MDKKMILIDGHGLAFRGFYALPETLTAPDGTPTNAITGFTNMLMKCIDDFGVDNVGMFFDPKGPTRRHEMFKEYKDGRKPTPESFKQQLPIIIDICRAIGVPVFIRSGVEADDFIVSTAENASKNGWNVTILSADKDLFQVINDKISVMRPMKGVSEFKSYDEQFFVDEFGFEPKLMADYLALVGDSADNIPGVPGIGEKGAKELVSKYGALEDIYRNLDLMPRGRRAKLEDGYDRAFKSRELIVPQPTDSVPADEIKMSQPDYGTLQDMCKWLGLKKVLQRFAPSFENSSGGENGAGNFSLEDIVSSTIADAHIIEIPLSELLEIKDLVLMKKTPSMGVVFALSDRAMRTAFLHADNEAEIAAFSKWAESGVLTLYGCRSLMARFTIPLPPLERIHDVEAAHYVLHPDRGGDAVAKTIGCALPSWEKCGLLLFKLWDLFYKEVKSRGLEKIITEIDMPLCPVLAALEREGFRADTEKLTSLGEDLRENIKFTEDEISNIAGERINLNSPKQVSWLLFERFKLPPIKKIASGFSTDAGVLEELAGLPEPLCEIPKKLIEYREQSKVLSGFVEPFAAMAKDSGGFIHSTFDHLNTGTGRLSSRDPNVQNMPVFGDWAVKFRSCFVPDKGKIFVAADYSQIELRVLAHLSGEERLIESFKEGRDIHSETASWVFGLPVSDINAEQRRFAKTVNFGLIYGMSAHGLAQRLGVSRVQAASMMERYFGVLPKVSSYLRSSVAEAKSRGYTESIFGRIRPLTELSTVEGRGGHPIDRVAQNTPIQSSASDIAKIALIRFFEVIKKEFGGAKIILQIHDSIVCECRENDADMVEKRLVETMEAVDVLSVPVKAEPKRGYSLNAL